MIRKHPFSVINGDVPDDVTPLKQLAHNAGYAHPVRQSSPIIEKLKVLYDDGVSNGVAHVMVFWDPHKREPKHYGVKTHDSARIILRERASNGKLDLLAVLDMKDPFDHQIHSDAHQRVTSWSTLGKYCEEDTSSFLISLGVKPDPSQMAAQLDPIEEAFDAAWERDDKGLLVYLQSNDNLILKPIRKDENAREINAQTSIRVPEAQLIMALDVNAELLCQLPFDLVEGKMPLSDLRPSPIDYLGVLTNSPQPSPKPPSPLRL